MHLEAVGCLTTAAAAAFLAAADCRAALSAARRCCAAALAVACWDVVCSRVALALAGLLPVPRARDPFIRVRVRRKACRVWR